MELRSVVPARFHATVEQGELGAHNKHSTLGMSVAPRMLQARLASCRLIALRAHSFNFSSSGRAEACRYTAEARRHTAEARRHTAEARRHTHLTRARAFSQTSAASRSLWSAASSRAETAAFTSLSKSVRRALSSDCATAREERSACRSTCRARKIREEPGTFFKTAGMRYISACLCLEPCTHSSTCRAGMTRETAAREAAETAS
eukprot:1159246-Pelagomonas_calceolata.AAC.2